MGDEILDVKRGDSISVSTGVSEARSCRVTFVFNPMRVLVDFDSDLQVICDFVDGGWEQSPIPARPEETVVIERLMPARDTTEVTVEDIGDVKAVLDRK